MCIIFDVESMAISSLSDKRYENTLRTKADELLETPFFLRFSEWLSCSNPVTPVFYFIGFGAISPRRSDRSRGFRRVE